MSVHKTRIMYIECKAGGLNGEARIGRVTFSKSGPTVEYCGRKFQKSKSGYKWNHFDVETGAEYWISGPKKDGKDRLYGQSTRPVEIDEDVREEYCPRFAVFHRRITAKRRTDRCRAIRGCAPRARPLNGPLNLQFGRPRAPSKAPEFPRE